MLVIFSIPQLWPSMALSKTKSTIATTITDAAASAAAGATRAGPEQHGRFVHYALASWRGHHVESVWPGRKHAQDNG